MKIYHDYQRPQDGRYQFVACEGSRGWVYLKPEPWEPFSADEVQALIVQARAVFDAEGAP